MHKIVNGSFFRLSHRFCRHIFLTCKAACTGATVAGPDGHVYTDSRTDSIFAYAAWHILRLFLTVNIFAVPGFCPSGVALGMRTKYSPHVFQPVRLVYLRIFRQRLMIIL